MKTVATSVITMELLQPPIVRESGTRSRQR
jgi:hypothetical protein